jgi:hypothetical protein
VNRFGPLSERSKAPRFSIIPAGGKPVGLPLPDYRPWPLFNTEKNGKELKKKGNLPPEGTKTASVFLPIVR